MLTLKHLAVVLFLFGSIANVKAVEVGESHKPEDCVATQTHGRNNIPEKSSKKPKTKTEKPKRVHVE